MVSRARQELSIPHPRAQTRTPEPWEGLNQSDMALSAGSSVGKLDKAVEIGEEWSRVGRGRFWTMAGG